eukprot:647154_1
MSSLSYNSKKRKLVSQLDNRKTKKQRMMNTNWNKTLDHFGFTKSNGSNSKKKKHLVNNLLPAPVTTKTNNQDITWRETENDLLYRLIHKTNMHQRSSNELYEENKLNVNYDEMKQYFENKLNSYGKSEEDKTQKIEHPKCTRVPKNNPQRDRKHEEQKDDDMDSLRFVSTTDSETFLDALI